MPIRIEREYNPGQTLGPAGMGNVPQRTTQRVDNQRAAQNHWDSQERYNKAQMLMNEPGARAVERNVTQGFMDAGYRSPEFTPHLQQGFEPGQGGKFGWPGNWPGTPIGLGMEPRWNYSVTPGEESAMGSGDFLSSKYGGGLDDVAGMNEGAMGMLEGAGFDVAGKTTDDRVIEKLWGKAVNSLPAGTPQMEIEKEWERLKAIYFDKKYTS
tara:strand:+ start:107 stop:739 length:633 start_codon:yes stop_codon:yes gene_type:complete